MDAGCWLIVEQVQGGRGDCCVVAWKKKKKKRWLQRERRDLFNYCRVWVLPQCTTPCENLLDAPEDCVKTSEAPARRAWVAGA